MIDSAHCDRKVPRRDGQRSAQRHKFNVFWDQQVPCQGAGYLGTDKGCRSAPSVTVNILEPGVLWGERVNEVDLRLAKLVRIGRTRTNLGFDVYNVLNGAPVLTYNQAYSPSTSTWLTPTSVLQPRFWKFSAQIDF